MESQEIVIHRCEFRSVSTLSSHEAFHWPRDWRAPNSIFKKKYPKLLHAGAALPNCSKGYAAAAAAAPPPKRELPAVSHGGKHDCPGDDFHGAKT